MTNTDSTSQLHKLGKPFIRASTSKLNTVVWNGAIR